MMANKKSMLSALTKAVGNTFIFLLRPKGTL